VPEPISAALEYPSRDGRLARISHGMTDEDGSAMSCGWIMSVHPVQRRVLR
jgi:hypothetical protein